MIDIKTITKNIAHNSSFFVVYSVYEGGFLKEIEECTPVLKELCDFYFRNKDRIDAKKSK